MLCHVVSCCVLCFGEILAPGSQPFGCRWVLPYRVSCVQVAAAQVNPPHPIQVMPAYSAAVSGRVMPPVPLVKKKWYPRNRVSEISSRCTRGDQGWGDQGWGDQG